MKCGIYKITNLINNKVYIGQSIHIEKRWSDHHNRPYNPNSPDYNCTLYKAIRKYGIDSFSFELLEECSSQDLDEREIYYIDFFNSYYEGYNETKGGKKNCVTWSKLTEAQVAEIKKKLSTQKYSLVDLSKEYNIHKDTIRDINNGTTWLDVGEYTKYPLYISYKSPLYKKKTNYCIDCGTEIDIKATRCVPCYKKYLSKNSKGKYPEDPQEIYNDIKILGFVRAGAKYGVSDNALRKHCAKIGLSRYKKDYK